MKRGIIHITTDSAEPIVSKDLESIREEYAIVFTKGPEPNVKIIKEPNRDEGYKNELDTHGMFGIIKELMADHGNKIPVDQLISRMGYNDLWSYWERITKEHEG